MKHSYFSKIGILLIVVALVAGILSCNGGNGGVEKYDLTMAENPAADCGTATDLTDTSPYAANTTVDIKAVAAACCRFVNWQAPAGGIGNTTAAETTFTMPARDVTVTANFELTPPDHFKFYEVDWKEGLYVGEDVQLVDQFGAINATVGDAVSFGNPAEKQHGENVTSIADPNRHYTLYELDYGKEEPMLDSWQVVVTNQFGENQELTVVGPVALAVPTRKGDHEAPECLNHYLVYDAYGLPMEVVVELNDQFIADNVTVYEPSYFANPVKKTVVETGDVAAIEDEDLHWVLYDISGEVPSIDKTIQIANQFGNDQVLNLTYRDTLAVPSQKIDWGKTLDHFKCYGAEWMDQPPMYEEPVQLQDQFITDWLGEPLNALVLEPELFANPVNKGHGEVWTPISNWDNHLTFYNLFYEELSPIWEVTVSNQFGPDQLLDVTGPVYLAVPTQKGPHDPPVDLDHFLLYEVLGDPPVLWEEIWLWDQFTDQPATVYPAAYFANPVQKIHGPITEPIKHPEDHLLFYYTDGGEFSEEWLPIANQFGPQILGVYQGWYGPYDLLGVPSQKIGFSIVD